MGFIYSGISDQLFRNINVSQFRPTELIEGSWELPEDCSGYTRYYRQANWYTKARTRAIDTITIHCYVGQIGAVGGCHNFYKAGDNYKASCNYVVDYNGYVSLCVPEHQRSWCTGGEAKHMTEVFKRLQHLGLGINDDRAITIEVASDTSYPYKITDAAAKGLVLLVADICARNSIKKLVWIPDTDEKDVSAENRIRHRMGSNMTVHRDFYCKECPGDYIMDGLPAIARAVNNRINNSTAKGPARLSGGLPYGTGDNQGQDIPYNDSVTEVVIAKQDIINIKLDTITATTASIQVTTDSQSPISYLWSYIATDILSNDSINGELSATEVGNNFNINISGLKPNRAYSFVVNAISSKADIKSPTIFLHTLPDSPMSITNLLVKFSENKPLENDVYISFSQPTSWGECSADDITKGYRVSLVVDGQVKAYSDSLIWHSGSNINKNISIGSLLDQCPVNTGSTLQLGVQTWVKTKENEYFFDSDFPICSKSIFLKSLFANIVAMHLKLEDGTRKRVMIYDNI